MQDQFGNPVSCQSAAAVQAYDRAVDAYLHAWPGALDALQEALHTSPDFALAHALRSLALAGRGQAAEAREALGQAHLAPVAHPRETAQIALIGCVVQGRTADALAAVIAHARQYPTDALAASTGMGAYGLFAFSGRADHDTARLAFADELAPHYPSDFAWLLAYRGWSRIEAGRVDEGLDMAQRAIRLRPTNGHNAHILLHGFYESQQAGAALAFVADWLPSYPDNALMWGHLQWHAALAEIEQGQIDEAIHRLAGPITRYLPAGTPFMGLADTASLLWHLGLAGASGLPWAMAQQHAERHFSKGSNVFGELHLAMLAAARQDRQALHAVRQRLETIGGSGHEGASVAVHWVQALLALLDGQTDSARVHLDACCADAVRLGGSHAQRSVITHTLDVLRLPQAG